MMMSACYVCVCVCVCVCSYYVMCLTSTCRWRHRSPSHVASARADARALPARSTTTTYIYDDHDDIIIQVLQPCNGYPTACCLLAPRSYLRTVASFLLLQIVRRSLAARGGDRSLQVKRNANKNKDKDKDNKQHIARCHIGTILGYAQSP